MTSRRKFIKQTALGSAGFLVAGSAMGMTAKSYRRIIGSNERVHVAIAGLGRRLGAFIEPIVMKQANVELVYLCDVMESQRLNSQKTFAEHLDYLPKSENDIRKVIDDPKVDAIINATPDHWHTPGSILALKGGKHVYVEKPSSHNMMENELLVEATKKFGKVVQMGNQQRSSHHTIEIINEIHKGVIGSPYKAVAFYTNAREEVPVQKQAPVPQGLDWDLWQGPAIRREYTE
ncbi:MAG TPA: Gfo/Idh/MocA family oxidoreductase, partial [Gillisia sp.]|nr:Gfo/Idh/MocA family oxidoreductase [Gillisia sp.]